MKRKILAVVLAAAMVLPMATHVCAEESAEKTVITFWNGFTGSDKETLEALVNEYNETNDKNIEVEMTIMPWDSL